MNNAITSFSRYTIFLCLGIFAAMTVIYMGMTYQMQQERQSVTGILYAQNPDAAKEYADIIMNDNVNNQNATDGVGAMVKLGYADTAFINNANRYPLNWMIASAVIGSFLIFAVLFMRDRKMRLYISEFTDFKNSYASVQKRMDGMNASLNQKNSQIRVFIENIAHQIRTPISYVYLTLDEIYEKYDKSLALIDCYKRDDNYFENDYSNGNELRQLMMNQNDKVKECINCIDRINELLSRLLKISRLESGKVIMEKQDCDIVAFICDICGEYPNPDIHLLIQPFNYVSIANAVNVANSANTEENIVHIDSEWFREAIVNIINNALEHSDKNVPVDVELTIDTYKVNISITNCGEDIAALDIPYIFDRFYTAENVLFSHTGIGLNLANLIISQHNGNIKLTSKNQHTEFLITIPKYKFTSKYEPAV